MVLSKDMENRAIHKKKGLSYLVPYSFGQYFARIVDHNWLRLVRFAEILLQYAILFPKPDVFMIKAIFIALKYSLSNKLE